MRRFPALLAAAVAVLLGGAALAATSFTVLHHFNPADPEDTFHPDHGLVRAGDGRLYGVAWEGELKGQTEPRHGSIFRIEAAGGVTVLHRFSGPDGRLVRDRLVEGPDGALYGTAPVGGAHPGDLETGAGTIFRITRAGAFRVLHHFSGRDGERPHGGLSRGRDGALYGVTAAGGGTQARPSNAGTVFRITPAGRFTRLHSFSFSDGSEPRGPLLPARDGNLYGVTQRGGQFSSGTVFRITPAGELTTLHSFHPLHFNEVDANGGLVEAPDGLLYGTTREGGDFNRGTIYRISKTGRYELLHSFDPPASEGFRPEVGLTLGRDGNLYGTCPAGGQPVTQAGPHPGSIYRYNRTGPRAGKVDVLHTFRLSEGNAARTLLAQDERGAMAGVVRFGGTHDGGTAFRFDPEEPLPVLSLVFSPAQVKAPGSVAGRVTLSRAAGRGGTRVSPASVTTPAVTVPASVTVPEGQLTATFQVRTRALVHGPVRARVSASVAGAGTSGVLNLLPSDTMPDPPVSQVRGPRDPVKGGQDTFGQVLLSQAPPPSGTVVPLRSGNPRLLRVPPSVLVPEHSLQGVFRISTSPVTQPVSVTVFVGRRRPRAITVRLVP